MTSCLPGHYFEPFSSAVPHFETRFSLARLVEAEIVSPYDGFSSIRAWVMLRLELALVFPEEEGMMQQSSVSISLSF